MEVKTTVLDGEKLGDFLSPDVVSSEEIDHQMDDDRSMFRSAPGLVQVWA